MDRPHCHVRNSHFLLWLYHSHSDPCPIPQINSSIFGMVWKRCWRGNPQINEVTRGSSFRSMLACVDFRCGIPWSRRQTYHVLSKRRYKPRYKKPWNNRVILLRRESSSTLELFDCSQLISGQATLWKKSELSCRSASLSRRSHHGRLKRLQLFIGRHGEIPQKTIILSPAFSSSDILHSMSILVYNNDIES